jgi:ubiquinone/menaquinone biosynthesis C-methylase UbiE
VKRSGFRQVAPAPAAVAPGAVEPALLDPAATAAGAGTTSPEPEWAQFDRAFSRRFAERAIDALLVVRGTRVLEVACGTGVFARLAAHVVGPGGRVVALEDADGSPETARRLEPSSAVEWRAWEGGTLPFEDGAFDVVACQHSLPRLADPLAVVGEMRRVLAPGGRLGVTTWGPIEENPAFAVQLDAAIKAGAGGAGVVDALLEACSMHRVDDLLRMVEAAGISDVSCRTVRMLAGLPPVAQWVRACPSLPPLSKAWPDWDEATRRAFLGRVTELLRPFEHEGVLRVQASCRLVVGRTPPRPG